MTQSYEQAKYTARRRRDMGGRRMSIHAGWKCCRRGTILKYLDDSVSLGQGSSGRVIFGRHQLAQVDEIYVNLSRVGVLALVLQQRVVLELQPGADVNDEVSIRYLRPAKKPYLRRVPSGILRPEGRSRKPVAGHGIRRVQSRATGREMIAVDVAELKLAVVGVLVERDKLQSSRRANDDGKRLVRLERRAPTSATANF